jgi:histidyl-tRNA synthetase
VDFRFDPFLARGLDYYTSTIYELKSVDYGAGSLAGGGRYDELIGNFTGKPIPAVGIAFGFDRVIEAMESLNLLSNLPTVSQVLVTVFSSDQIGASLDLVSRMRKASIHTEIYLDPEAKLEKQLKYADRKKIPYVIIQGPEEVTKNVVKLKTMATKEQAELTIEAVINKLTKAS